MPLNFLCVHFIVLRTHHTYTLSPLSPYLMLTFNSVSSGTAGRPAALEIFQNHRRLAQPELRHVPGQVRHKACGCENIEMFRISISAVCTQAFMCVASHVRLVARELFCQSTRAIRPSGGVIQARWQHRYVRVRWGSHFHQVEVE